MRCSLLQCSEQLFDERQLLGGQPSAKLVQQSSPQSFRIATPLPRRGSAWGRSWPGALHERNLRPLGVENLQRVTVILAATVSPLASCSS